MESRLQVGSIKEAPGFPLHSSELYRFYRLRHFEPAWFRDARLSPEGELCLATLREAANEGLSPGEYHLFTIDRILARLSKASEKSSEEDQINAELLLTDAFLHYASHMVAGRIDPRDVHDAWDIPRRKVDTVVLLKNGLESSDLATALKKLSPSSRQYRLLKEHLAKFRSDESLTNWSRIPEGAYIRPGGMDTRIPLLRRRLGIGPDAIRKGLNPQIYDADTAEALKQFQRRHGLQPDGILGRETVDALNVPLAERIRQIELNLERWRWLPESLGDRYLLVNIPGFQLQMIENEQPVLAMAVVIGTLYRKTPLFASQMTALEFAPYWNVPPTILKEDKLPLFKAAPHLVTQKHFEIVSWNGGRLLDPRSLDWKSLSVSNFPGQLRQKPGPWNPLGKVKFLFQNPYSVYLHDTPSHDLFERNFRAFSSGCIRLEDAAALATTLLEKEGFSRGDVEHLLMSTKPVRISLKRTLPIYLLYLTAWIDGDGEVNFGRDIYSQDKILSERLPSRMEHP